MKYIIDIEDEPKGGLYKAKNFRTLVFDENGLRKLEPYKAAENFTVGDEVRDDHGRKYLVTNVYPSTVKVIDGDGCGYLFQKNVLKKSTYHYAPLAFILESLRGE